MSESTIAVLGFLLVSGGIIYFLSASGKRKFKSLLQVLDKGGTNLQFGRSVQRVEGRFSGRRAQIYAQGGRGGNEIIFGLACSSPLRFVAVELPKLGPLTQFYRAEYSKVLTGDPGLDADFGFSSPDPERFKAWVVRPENNQAIRTIARTATRGVECRVEAVEGWVRWTGLNMWQFKPETTRPVLERLNAFAGILERAS